MEISKKEKTKAIIFILIPLVGFLLSFINTIAEENLRAFCKDSTTECIDIDKDGSNLNVFQKFFLKKWLK